MSDRHWQAAAVGRWWLWVGKGYTVANSFLPVSHVRLSGAAVATYLPVGLGASRGEEKVEGKTAGTTGSA